jgi:hypothetical protein
LHPKCLGPVSGGARWERHKYRELLAALMSTPFLYSYFRIRLCVDSVGSEMITLSWILLKTECEGLNFIGTFNWSAVCVSLVGPSRSLALDWLWENVFMPAYIKQLRYSFSRYVGRWILSHICIQKISNITYFTLHTLLSVFFPLLGNHNRYRM